MLLSLLLAGTPSMVGSSPILFKGPRWEKWNPSVHENSATSPVYITILLRNLTGDMFQRKGGWYPTPWRCTSFSNVHLAPSYCLWICYTPKPFSSITLPPFQAPLRSISKGAHKENAVNFDRLALVGWLRNRSMELATQPCVRCQHL